jgi:hypothetical protein
MKKNIEKDNILIETVQNRRQLKKFIDFPLSLYKNNPYFTPYIFEDELTNLTPSKNPTSSYCDFKLFMAYKNNRLVGRVCAIINHYSNKKYNERRIRFNRIDMIDDIEVTKALLKAVSDYGKANAMNEVVGPLGFSDQDKEGMLTHGFDQKNMFVTFYTHQYYPEHLKQLGFVVDAVWNEYQIEIPKQLDPRFVKLAEYAAKKNEVKIIKIKNKRKLKPYVYQVLQLVNVAYDHLYGYVPIEKGAMDLLAKQHIPLINLDYLQLVVDKNDKLVAFGLMIPSPVDALKKCNGHLLPFGWIRFLLALKTSKVLDMLLVAIDPAYKKSGIMSLIFVEAIKNAMKNKIKYAESGPELSDNQDVQSLWKSFSYKKHKQRACFKSKID